MITPLPGATPTKPGTATLPFYGVVPEVVDSQGNAVPTNCGGKLVIRRSLFAQAWFRGVWGDPVSHGHLLEGGPGSYFTGDGCRTDKDGYFWIVGRIDDVLNVAGHRIGTAEVESARRTTIRRSRKPRSVGRWMNWKGQRLVAFVTLKTGTPMTGALRDELRGHVAKEIGPVAKPDDIRFAEALPKTRSGKIMRRLLKEVAAGAEIKGDTTHPRRLPRSWPNWRTWKNDVDAPLEAFLSRWRVSPADPGWMLI